MPNDLRASLFALAQTFASQGLQVKRAASVVEIIGEMRTTAPRPHHTKRIANGNNRNPQRKPACQLLRPTSEETAKQIEQIVATLEKTAALPSEDRQKALGLDRREVPRVLKLELSTKNMIESKGVKRSIRSGAA